MPRPRDEDSRADGQGNWLGKQKVNYSVSGRFRKMLHALALEYGVNHSVMLEICVRDKYKQEIGMVPEIHIPGRGEAK